MSGALAAAAVIGAACYALGRRARTDVLDALTWDRPRDVDVLPPGGPPWWPWSESAPEPPPAAEVCPDRGASCMRYCHARAACSARAGCTCPALWPSVGRHMAACPLRDETPGGTP